MARIPEFVVQTRDPSRERRQRVLWVLAWLASLALVGVLVAVLAAHGVVNPGPSAELKAARAENNELESRIALLTRSEQVAKTALVELQNSMRERDAQVDGLRADLAFYGRLLGGKREGLSVYALRMTPVADSKAWNFIATLTQNFKRGDDTKGQLMLAVEGVSDGKVQTLDWKTLAAAGNDGGIDYSFKYFEQVRGTIALPDGFTPSRVVVRAEGDGARTEQSFAWADAIKGQESENVSQ